MNRPRLLFVVNSARFFLSHRLDLARAAREAGFEVHVATGEREDGEEEIRAGGFEYYPLSMTRTGVRPWEEVMNVIEITGLYRRLRPQLVHHVTVKPILYGGAAARLAGVPAVVNAVTGLGSILAARTVPARVLRALILTGYRFSLSHPRQRLIFQNPDDRDFFLERGLVDEGESVVIRGSGVDVQEFTPTPEPGGDPLVVLASRMLWSKGVGTFVEAARSLDRAGVPARYALVGPEDTTSPDSVSHEQLESLETVDWWGYCDDMPAVLASSAVVCLPSMYGEGVPRILIEGAASGRPLVATDVPGCREIVRHGHNGLLVSPGEPEELANAIAELLEDRDLRRRMGKHGRVLAESEFSLTSVNRRTIDVYRELLEQMGETESRVSNVGRIRTARSDSSS